MTGLSSTLERALEASGSLILADRRGLADLHLAWAPLPQAGWDRAGAGERLLALGTTGALGRPFLLLDSAGGDPRLAERSVLLGDAAWSVAIEGEARAPRVRLLPSPSRDERLADAAAEAVDRCASVIAAPRRPRDPARDAIAEVLGHLRAAQPEHASAVPGGPALPPVLGGLAGLVSYEATGLQEDVPEAGARLLASPLLSWTLYRSAVVADFAGGTLWAGSMTGADRAHDLLRGAAAVRPLPPPPTVAVAPELHRHTTRDAFVAGVRRVQGHIREGDLYQANLTLAVSAPAPDPLYSFRRLRRINPSPFGAFLAPSGDGEPLVASSSPERLVRALGTRAEARPIAGTRPRGTTPAEERRLEEELIASEKERAEHTMLVDLVRNDLGRVARPGSVRVDEFATVEDYSHVKHLVSGVSAQLGSVEDQPALAASFFPGGTITGAPKVRACQILAALEPHTRGPYTGSLGYCSTTGNLDLNILIRTLVFSGGRVFAQAGAGIVADSDPEAEHRESLQKAEALLRAFGGTLLGR